MSKQKSKQTKQKQTFGSKIRYGDISAIVDIEKLAEIIGADEKYFRKFGKVINTQYNGPLIFKDNGSKILAVAHLDTVQKPAFHGWFYADFDTVKNDNWQFKPIGNNKTNVAVLPNGHVSKKEGPLLSKDRAYMCCSATGLDDRLGAFIILELLPQIGVECDILLTTNEERGNSSAQGFQEHIADKLGKEYNWIVEFDRRGGDVVTYKYKTKEFTEALETAKFNIGVGSYSDICDMYEHGVCALNVGVGYERAHGIDSWFCVDVMFVNLNKFWNFYQLFKDHKFEIDTSKWTSRRQAFASTVRTYPYNYDDYDYGYMYDHKAYTEYGKEFESVWFFCKGCQKRYADIKKNDFFTCECGNEFWRGSTTGDIFIKSDYNNGAQGYKLYYKIESWNKSYRARHAQQERLWHDCSVCTTQSSVKMPLIDGKNVCSRCRTLFFSQCEWCESWFFNMKIDGITLCEDCNEVLYQYNTKNKDNNNNDNDNNKYKEEQRSIVVYEQQTNKPNSRTAGSTRDWEPTAVEVINDSARAPKDNGRPI